MCTKHKKIKICLVTSSGGHLWQLFNLMQWWSKYDRFWVTFNKVDAVSLLKSERKYFGFFPTNRNLKNLLLNTYLAIKILIKERPNVVISNGAGIAIPFFYISKILGAKLIFFEVYDRISTPTLTGRLVYPIVDKFLIQWEDQRKFFPKAEFWGTAV